MINVTRKARKFEVIRNLLRISHSPLHFIDIKMESEMEMVSSWSQSSSPNSMPRAWVPMVSQACLGLRLDSNGFLNG
jgi:hypothetical protein